MNRLGFLSKLPTLETMFDVSDVVPLVFADIQLTFEVGVLGWNSAGSDTWFSSFDGAQIKLGNNTLDIVDVMFNLTTPNVIAIDTSPVLPQLDNGLYGLHLRRAETLAECQATAGSFYINTDYPRFAKWDDEISVWDDGVSIWDSQTGVLYVHLPSPGTTDTSSDPNDYTISARANIPISNGPKDSAALYSGINSGIVNGSFEEAGLANWTTAAGSGVTVTVTSVRALKGTTSAAIEGDGVSGVAQGILRQTKTTVVGQKYRVSGAYYINESSEEGWFPYIAISDAGITDVILTDGRNLRGAFLRTLLNGDKGRWYRFKFDYIAWDTSITLNFYGRTDVGASGLIFFDDIDHQVIARYESYSNRLISESIPQISSGTNDSRFGSKITTSVSLQMLNGDGALYDTFGVEIVSGAQNATPLSGEVSIDVGYSSEQNGEMPREAFDKIFLGTVDRVPKIDDNMASVSASDFRSVFQDLVPPHVASLDDFVDADERSYGKPVPMLFGQKGHIIPTMLTRGLAANADGGVYSFNDPSFTTIYDTSVLNQGVTLDYYMYADEKARDIVDTARRVSMDIAGSVENFRGASQLFFDNVILEVLDGGSVGGLGNSKGTRQQNWIDWKFDIGTKPPTTLYAAQVPAGVYAAWNQWDPAKGFAQVLAAAMNAVHNLPYQVFYGPDTRFQLVSDFGGGFAGFEVLVLSGIHAKVGVYKIAGQDEGVDATGNFAYTAQNPVWTSAEESEIVALRVSGYPDDSIGTWTGTADALIRKGVDITRFVAAKVYGLDTVRVFDNSILNSFRSNPQAYNLGVFLDEQISGVALLEGLEISDFAEYIFDGGKISIRSLVDATINHTVEEKDILFYAASETTREVKDAVEIEYDITSGRRPTRRNRRGAGRLRGNRSTSLNRTSYIIDVEEAGLLNRRIGDLTEKTSVFHNIRTIGKLMGGRYGDRVFLSRDKGLGTLSEKLCKITRIKKNYLTREVDTVLLEE